MLLLPNWPMVGNDILLPNGPPLFSHGIPVLGCLACLQGIIALNVRDWWKGKELFIQKLYRLKSNDLMSSLKSQSPLKHPQTHTVLPSPLCPVQSTVLCGYENRRGLEVVLERGTARQTLRSLRHWGATSLEQWMPAGAGSVVSCGIQNWGLMKGERRHLSPSRLSWLYCWRGL